ncbi:hypothetical protein [Kribbella sp. CA-293567]|uniref:hypothetical protein n=1 Tax=Kribbella sp. CA-293567 TaxID=3002436 RepID=UPI0022DDF001|nr:hypothetical protein [Kribbella sp. CA-293567]WBQ02074.1 hypothetical protein OX958_18975 [Kribbella sp. CA-293567]
MIPVKHLVLRTAAGLVGTFLAFSVTATATAASGPDLAAAANAAHSAEATKLLNKAAQSHSTGSAKSSATSKLAVQQATIPVYALSADFVRTGSGDVGTLWYVATPATKGSTKLTVFTAPDQAGAWHPVNVATGNTEATMAAAARGGKLLTEPQIGAWYAVNGSTLRALNPEATKAVGSNPVSLAAYRQQVSSRYADKQADSAYAKNGTAGGYNESATVTRTSTGPDTGLVLAGGAALTTALAAVVLLTRRRRAN